MVEDKVNLYDGLLLIVSALVAVWGIYQTRVTKQLEQNIHHLNVALDQSIQLLHRAREAAIKIHSAYIFLLEIGYNNSENLETHATKYAELSAYNAELRGLAFAIKDDELLQTVDKSYNFLNQSPKDRSFWLDEVEIQGKSEKLHKRISELIELATMQK
jgi:hypothetical protein